MADIFTKNVKEQVFKKHAKTTNNGKVKYKIENENENHKTENETKYIKFMNTRREDVKVINVGDTSKYGRSGH